MTKQTLIVVHGMGVHKPAPFKKEVVGALKKAFGLYESLKNKNPVDEIDVSVFVYDKLFERHRAAIDADEDLLNALRAVSGEFAILGDAAAGINALDASLKEDRFFNTHWLDVVLYRYTLLSEAIRIRLGALIADAVAKKGSSNVHVLGHSLGTAVVHDTLAKLYGPEPEERKLSNDQSRLGSVHMVANVSRLLQTFRKVGSSEVRPGIGCCSFFCEYRHKLDPIPRFKPFDPTNNGQWVPHETWKKRYELIEPSAVTKANVHSLDHYLLDPMVHVPLFELILDHGLKAAEKRNAEKNFNKLTLAGRAEVLQQSLETFNFSEPSITKLLNAAKDMKDIVEQFGEDFK